MREIEEPTVDERGDEHHPSFAVIGAYRGSCGPPGAALFDSDIRHQHTIRIRIKSATRKRDLNHDWIHGGKQYIEVELSESQWASFVSAMNSGDGVPCTLTDLGYEQIPSAPFHPRLQESLKEVRGEAERAFDKIRDARDAYEAVLADKTSKVAARREALSALHAAIENAGSGVEFAGKSLQGHAEKVVNNAKADVEAFVLAKARSIGYEPEELGFHEDNFAALGTGGPRCETCGDTKVITVQYRDHAQEQECDDCCGD
jgi:hypothetical protein